MKLKTIKKSITTILSVVLISHTFFSSGLTAFAVVDYQAQAEARKSLPVQSNSYENWPYGPALGAESAILMEANTGAILYAKNIDEKLYPASTTKILTTLIAAETCDMNEIVEFSEKAIHSIDWRNDSNMGIKVGNKITMEQTLYGILVGSANEAAYAVGEHISGSIEEFSKVMNEKAKELGCKNSNFVNPSGIFNENHYTTAYDLATIARAFFKNELLCKMSGTASYQVPQTATQPNAEMIVHSKNKLITTKKYAYEGFVGSKTGYTDDARQTLVSCAKKDGLTLICVIMKEESPNQFADTIALFDYGFSNFKAFNISENEEKYSIDNSDFFEANKDVFGNSKPILSLNQDDYIVLPNTSVFSDAVSSLSYDVETNSSIAKINYEYNGIFVGSATVDIALDETLPNYFEDGTPAEIVPEEPEEKNTIFINVKKVLLWTLVIAGVVILFFVARAFLGNYYFGRRRRSRRKRKRRKGLRDVFTRYYD